MKSLNGLGIVNTLIAFSSKINVRDQPSTTSKVLRTVEKGKVVGTPVDSFEGGDGYTWYELKEGGFVREDVVEGVAGPAKNESIFKFSNPWLIAIGCALIAGVAVAVTSPRPDEKAVPSLSNSALSGRSKRRILKPTFQK